jgi:hypothetical protein
MQKDHRGRLSYTARTVTARGRDIRDERTDHIHAFIEAGIYAPEKAEAINHSLGLAPPPVAGWPQPTDQARHIAKHAIREALPSIARAAHQSGIPSLFWAANQASARTPGSLLYCAPLTGELEAPKTLHELSELLAYAWSRHTSSLFRTPGADNLDDAEGTRETVGVNLLRRLNKHLAREAYLWRLARMGGFSEPPPYAVRYEAARWLWTPAIPAVAFCLRCGCDLDFERAVRTGATRDLRCQRCARGKPNAWPTNAIAPAEAGTWWLRCHAQDCSRWFVGPTQARRCSRCKLSRTTPRKRVLLKS